MPINSNYYSYNAHTLDLGKTSLSKQNTNTISIISQRVSRPLLATSQSNIFSLDLAVHTEVDRYIDSRQLLQQDSDQFLKRNNTQPQDITIWSELFKLNDSKKSLNQFIVGGKIENFCVVDQYLLKKVSDKEFEFYKENLTFLEQHSNYCPKVYSILELGADKIIVMENLRKAFAKTFQIDVKVGKSFENEFFLKTKKSKPIEKIKKLIEYRQGKNKRTGADKNHFSIANYSGRKKPENKKDTHLSLAETQMLLSGNQLPSLAKGKIKRDIENILAIETALFNEDTTVVASSILIILDEDNPENAIARRIDFGNYWKVDTQDIQQSTTGIQQSNQENIKGIRSLVNMLM